MPRAARYFLFFLLGCHLPALAHRLAGWSNAVKTAAGAAVCVAAAAGAVALDIRLVPGVALALNVLALAFGILFAGWISRYRLGQPLVALGRNTLPVYLIHVLWLALVVTGIQYLTLSPLAAHTLPVALTLAVTGFSLLTHRVLVGAGATALFALPSRLAYRDPRRRT